MSTRLSRLFGSTPAERRTRYGVLVAAVIVVPLAVAGLVSGAFAGATDNVESIPAVVVNNDEMVTMTLPDGTDQPVLAGRQLVTELTGPDTAGFSWTISNDEEAAELLESGDAYAVLTIPSDFSSSVTSLSGDAPTKANLDIRTDDAHGYLAGSVAQSVGDAMTTAFGRELTAQYLEGFYSNLATVGGSLGDAADGATQISSGVDSLAGGLGQLSSGVAATASGAADAATGASAYADGVSQYADGVAQYTSGVDGLSGGLDPARDRHDGPRRARDRRRRLHLGGRRVHGAARRRHGADPREPDPGGHPPGSTPSSRRSAAPSPQSRSRAPRSPRARPACPPSRAASPTRHRGAQQLAGGSEAIRSGGSELADGGYGLASGIDELAVGLGTLATGAADAANGATQLAGGAGDLAEGLTTGAEQATALTDIDAATTADVVSQPVTSTTERDNEIGSIGEVIGMLFVPIGLWLGAMAMFLVFRPFDREALRSTASTGGIVVRALARTGLLALAQAVAVVLLLHGALGVSWAILPQTLAFAALLALAFTAIHAFLTVALGRAGMLVSLVLVALQLAASGGLYPVEVLSGPFQAISPFLPLTWAVQGMQLIVAGASGGAVAAAAGMVALFGLGGVIGTAFVVARRRGIRSIGFAATALG